MKIGLAIALLATPGPVFAQLEEGLCHDIRMVIASAHQREPFGRVTNHENWDEFRLFEMCRPNRYEPIDRVLCHWRLPSNQDVRPALAAEAARCLPNARREDVPNLPPSQPNIRFVLGDLSIYVSQVRASPDQLSEFADLLVVIREGAEEIEGVTPAVPQ